MVLGKESLRLTEKEEANRHRLNGILCPQSVAVDGVTTAPGTVPYDIFFNILSSRFHGTVYPVAPGKRNICTVRAYRSVLNINSLIASLGHNTVANVWIRLAA